MFLFYRELEQLVSGMSRPQCRMMAEQVLRDTAPLDCQLTNILSRGQLGEDAQRRVKQLRLVLYHLGRWHNKESESTMQNQTAHVGTVPFVDIVQPRIRECKTKSHSSVRYCSIYLEGVHNVKRFWCTSPWCHRWTDRSKRILRILQMMLIMAGLVMWHVEIDICIDH